MLSVCLAVPSNSQIVSQPVQICLGLGKCLTANEVPVLGCL